VRSSNASLPSRIEWRPSRLLQAVLCALGLLAAAAVAISGLPAAVRLGLGVLILAYTAHVILHERRRPRLTLHWHGGDAGIALGQGEVTQVLGELCLHRRGAVLQLAFRDAQGKRRTLVWWPDTLNAEQRRALVLACSSNTARDSGVPLMAG
jgi:toxin CptA